MIKKSSFVLGMVILLLFSASIIQAQQNYTIHSVAFVPDNEDIEWKRDSNGTYLKDTSPTGRMYAPVILPQDATIISVTLSYTDNADPGNITFYVKRINLYTKIVTTLFSASTSGTPGEGEVIDFTLNAGSRVVKNNSFAYVTYVSINDTSDGYQLKWHAIKIKYQ